MVGECNERSLKNACLSLNWKINSLDFLICFLCDKYSFKWGVSIIFGVKEPFESYEIKTTELFVTKKVGRERPWSTVLNYRRPCHILWLPVVLDNWLCLLHSWQTLRMFHHAMLCNKIQGTFQKDFSPNYALCHSRSSRVFSTWAYSTFLYTLNLFKITILWSNNKYFNEIWPSDISKHSSSISIAINQLLHLCWDD